MLRGSSTVWGNRLLTGLTGRLLGHAAGITGVEGVNVLVLMSFLFKGLYYYSDEYQNDDDFHEEGGYPQKKSDNAACHQ